MASHNYFRNIEENLKSSKHTQLQTVPNDCQIEPTIRTAPQISGMAATPMANSCNAIDSRHLNHQLASDQEPPEIDETDPDVIPNQYGKW